MTDAVENPSQGLKVWVYGMMMRVICVSDMGKTRGKWRYRHALGSTKGMTEGDHEGGFGLQGVRPQLLLQVWYGIQPGISCSVVFDNVRAFA